MGVGLGNYVGGRRREKESLVDRVTNCSNKTFVNKDTMLHMTQSELTTSTTCTCCSLVYTP